MLAAAVGCGAAYTRHLERRWVHRLAPAVFEQKNQGASLSRLALQQADLLVVLGSSELLEQRPYQAPFEANSVFRTYPTGFDVFLVAKPHNACLTMLQALAALGPQLRGRKIVISISPPWFFLRPQAGLEGYGGNFSALHAVELAYSTDLSLDLKRAAADRMLDYPETLEKLPLLRFALERLSDATPLDTALYWGTFPLGRLNAAILGVQDDWEMLRFIESRRPREEKPRREAPIDWPQLLADAHLAHGRNSRGNPYGMDHLTWSEDVQKLDTRDPADGARYREYMGEEARWLDLELLLRGLRELGADALVLGTPIHGAFYDAQGLGAEDRARYYQRVQALARAHGIGTQLFADREYDRDFSIDPFGHMSPVGWIHFDRALDAFFNGRAP